VRSLDLRPNRTHTQGVRLRAIGTLLLLCATAAAGGQSCPIYQTEFDEFAGPPAWANGPFAVSWCLSGATVTGSNFCPTGNALRLDATGEDPVLLVRVGDAGCASVTLSFTYSQFAATGTVLKVGATSATSASCSLATPTTLVALAATGGACTPVTVTAPTGSAQGLVFRFDHGANTNAILIDSVVVSVTGCCGATHGCCETGFAGCADAAVQACVCAVDSYCCAVAWDALCVAHVESLGCGSCGPPPLECLEAFATDFGTLYQTQSICLLRPDLFEFCEGAPPTLTISGPCAGAADPALRFGTGFPHSAAVTRCLDLSGLPAPRLRFRYTRNPGTVGPRIDWSSDDSGWAVAWQPSSTAGIGVCAEVALDLTPLRDLPGVRFRFTSASSLANGAVFDDLILESGPPICGAAEAGDCLVAHASPACADGDCCGAVCAVDDYCCAVAWDALCVEAAQLLCAGAGCGKGLGSCLLSRAEPGCGDPTCCGEVCVVDPFCCLVSWDELCALAAAGLGCAPPQGPAGDLTGDGRVDGADLAILLANWGGSGAGDLDGSGAIDGADLANLLASWTG
jgi:hypothetical protein